MRRELATGERGQKSLVKGRKMGPKLSTQFCALFNLVILSDSWCSETRVKDSSEDKTVIAVRR